MKKNLIPLLILAACLAGAGLSAESNNTFYLLAGLDAKSIGNQDANRYFNLDGQLGPQGYSSAFGRLGYQFLSWTALEASARFSLPRNNEVSYENAGIITRRITTRWAVNTYSLMPALTWVSPGYVHLLGLRVGLANLYGHVDDSAYGLNGSYDQEGQTYDVGLLIRSSQIVVGHISFGLELGYDWTTFRDIKNKNGTGAYDPVHSPERDISTIGHNGDTTTLDFSGAHLALVFGLWNRPPMASNAPLPLTQTVLSLPNDPSR